MQDDGLIGHAGGGHQGHGFVLVSLGLNFPRDGFAALHDELRSVRTRHSLKLPMAGA